MDSQRPFLYLTLIFLGFLLWTTWQADHAPKPETPAIQQSATDSVDGSSVPDASAAGVPANTATGAIPTENALSTAQGVQIIKVRTDVLDLQISTKGGDIVVADLPTYPVSLEEPDNPSRILDRAGKNYVAQSGLQHAAVTGLDGDALAKLAPNHLANYTAAQTVFQMEEGTDELVVPMTWQSPDGVTVTKRYHFKRGNFEIKVEHEVQNNSPQMWTGTEYRQLMHGPDNTERSLLMGVQAFVGGAYYNKDKYDTISFDDMSEGLSTEDDKATGGWVSMMQHYFVSAWVPPQTEQTQYYSREIRTLGVPGYILGARSPMKQVASGAKDTFQTSLWIGPKLQEDLEVIAEGLDLTVDYGIFAFISKPIFWMMKLIHGVVQNWGWTIIFLTLFIKLLFFWPSAASYKSMAKMKAMAPKLKELGERYENDPQAKQKAMMEIYRKEKLNPLGGCLPILIQIPVFMGLYWVLLESVEIRQAPWLLWYKDLSIMDPYFVLPLIMGASMYLQQKLNPPQVDPMQQKIFQFLPVVFTFMFLWFPAGLVLYWVVNNLLSIAQQWYINKKIIGHA
uniref:Membrane protein insertase YidC n=1 Tax=uncultured Thiotrichaceae bacterium TaxID=298394 RepID=A0A6S6UHW3_9GAMM|nr:MAG: Inner membrane protein translocase component YidC, long form [uncultured Thiotrichaceae bacterium]